MTLYVLHKYAIKKGKSSLWLLPVISIVWVNSHALFVTGWAAMFLVFCGMWIRDRKPDFRLAGYGVLSFAVGFINPYFIRGVLFPLELLTRFDSGNIFSKAVPEFFFSL